MELSQRGVPPETPSRHTAPRCLVWAGALTFEFRAGAVAELKQDDHSSESRAAQAIADVKTDLQTDVESVSGALESVRDPHTKARTLTRHDGPNHLGL